LRQHPLILKILLTEVFHRLNEFKAGFFENTYFIGFTHQAYLFNRPGIKTVNIDLGLPGSRVVLKALDGLQSLLPPGCDMCEQVRQSFIALLLKEGSLGR
jgi:hypothetical protein